MPVTKPPKKKAAAPKRPSKKTAGALPTTSEVLEGLRQQLERQPKDTELLINYGEAALRAGQFAEAIEAYEKAITLDPRADLRITYYQWKGYHHQAIAERFLASPAADDDPANLEQALAEFNLALDSYTKWTNLDPQSVEALDRQSALLVLLQRSTELYLLQPHYTKLAEINVPGARTSYTLHSFTIQEAGYGPEQNLLDRTYASLEANPKDISLRYLLAMLLYRQGQLEAADREVTCVLELSETKLWREWRFGLRWDRRSALLLKARLARLRGRSPEALALLQQVRGSGEAGQAEMVYDGVDELAALLLENGRYAELLELLPLHLRGQAPPNWITTAQILALLGLGQLEQARKLSAHFELAEMASLEPSRAPEFAVVDDDPKRVLQKLKGRRSSSHTQWARAEAYRELGKLAQALKCNHSALLLDPLHPDLWRQAAALHYMKGDLGAAQLAQIQSESLEQRNVARRPTGFLWPVSGSPIAFRFTASKRIGKPSLRVTGPFSKNFEDLGIFALNLLHSRSEAFSLEDPSYHELHLHVSALGRLPSDKRQVFEAAWDEAGCAIFAALAAALAGPNLQLPTWVLFGRLEQNGGILGPVDVIESLPSLEQQAIAWEKLLLPRASSPQLLEISTSAWLGRDLALVDQVEQLLEVLMMLRQHRSANFIEGGSR